ncbi:MAG: hypothetical protein AAF922_07885, partial [Pseudomonadota bacterium]
PLPFGENGDGRGQDKSTAGAGIFDAEPRETVYLSCGERRGKASRFPRHEQCSGTPAASTQRQGSTPNGQDRMHMSLKSGNRF